MARSDDIRDDVRRRLLDTGEFADVKTSGLPEEHGFGTECAVAVVGMPSRRRTPRWDGGPGIGYTIDERATVTILVRDQDPETRDRRADLLASVLENAVNGRSLAGITVPDHTYVESGRPVPPKAPERRFEAVVYYQYIQTGIESADTTP